MLILGQYLFILVLFSWHVSFFFFFFSWIRVEFALEMRITNCSILDFFSRMHFVKQNFNCAEYPSSSVVAILSCNRKNDYQNLFVCTPNCNHYQCCTRTIGSLLHCMVEVV